MGLCYRFGLGLVIMVCGCLVSWNGMLDGDSSIMLEFFGHRR